MSDATDDDVPLDVTLDIVRRQLDALAAFVAAYVEADPLDTSPDERRRLREVRDLLDEAVDRFT